MLCQRRRGEKKSIIEPLPIRAYRFQRPRQGQESAARAPWRRHPDWRPVPARRPVVPLWFRIPERVRGHPTHRPVQKGQRSARFQTALGARQPIVHGRNRARSSRALRWLSHPTPRSEQDDCRRTTPSAPCDSIGVYQDSASDTGFRGRWPRIPSACSCAILHPPKARCRPVPDTTATPDIAPRPPPSRPFDTTSQISTKNLVADREGWRETGYVPHRQRSIGRVASREDMPRRPQGHLPSIRAVACQAAGAQGQK